MCLRKLNIHSSVQHSHWPCCKLQVNSAKTAKEQAEQDPDLPRLASDVLGKVQSHLCLTEWRGKWKCRRGKSTLGAACPAQKIMFFNLCCTQHSSKSQMNNLTSATKINDQFHCPSNKTKNNSYIDLTLMLLVANFANTK